MLSIAKVSSIRHSGTLQSHLIASPDKTIILVVSTLFVVQITTMITIALSKLKPDGIHSSALSDA